MLVSKYRLNSDKIPGFMLLVYHDGQLNSCLLNFTARLKPDQWDRLKHNLPYDEQYVQILSNIGLKVTKLGNKDNQQYGKKDKRV